MTDSMKGWVDWAARAAIVAVCILLWESYNKLTKLEAEVEDLGRAKSLHWDYLGYLDNELIQTRHSAGLPPSKKWNPRQDAAK